MFWHTRVPSLIEVEFWYHHGRYGFRKFSSRAKLRFHDSRWRSLIRAARRLDRAREEYALTSHELERALGEEVDAHSPLHRRQIRAWNRALDCERRFEHLVKCRLKSLSRAGVSVDVSVNDTAFRRVRQGELGSIAEHMIGTPSLRIIGQHGTAQANTEGLTSESAT